MAELFEKKEKKKKKLNICLEKVKTSLRKTSYSRIIQRKIKTLFLKENEFNI